METISYYFNKEIFKIEIKWTNNKNMYLKVENEKVVCSVPKGTSMIDIKLFADQHARKFYEYSKKTKEKQLYSLREDFLYLFGKKYSIVRLIGKNKVNIIANNIYIYSSENSDEKIEKIIKNILKEQTAKYIISRQKYFEKAMDIVEHANKFVYKTSTWGSNYVNEKRIIFSTKLAHYREEVIDYVIVHELAHNKQRNHSTDFWNVVENYIPNYKNLRKELRADTKMQDE